MAKKDKWLEELKEKIFKALGKDASQKELRKILTGSYLDSFDDKEIKDSGKIVETLLKIAPAKEDVKENELGEPISILAYAESIIDWKIPPVLIKAETIFEEGDKKKIMAKITEPFRMGEKVKYDRGEKYDAMSKAAKPKSKPEDEASAEEEKEYLEFDPARMIEEKIEGETMTAEKNLSWEQIRENIEKSEQKKKVYDPASTMSVFAENNLEDALLARKELEARRRMLEQRRALNAKKDDIELRLRKNEEMLRQREEAEANDYLGVDDPLERTIQDNIE